MTPRRSIPLPALAAALLLSSGAATAAELEVSPVVVELSATGRTALLVVRNAGSTRTRLQARALSWAQGTDGVMKLAPTRELAVFPPLLDLAPGETRNLRVGTDAAPGEVERSWRLSVEELPRSDDPEAGMKVRVLTRLGLPVFLAPARGARTAGQLAFLEGSGSRLRVALRNTGTVRLRPSAVTLALVGAGGERIVEKPLESWYVLPRGERIYEVEVSPADCARAAEAVVTATLEAGALEARAAGACRGP